MERKKNEALGRPMLTKKVDMSVFVRTLVYEVRTAAQSVAGATARAGADASASVGAGAEAAAAAGDGAPCRAGAGVGAGVGVDARSSGRLDGSADAVSAQSLAGSD